MLGILVIAAGAAQASGREADAIRAVYRLTNSCYEHKDFKTLATTVTPDFYAVDDKGAKISHAVIEASIAKRFASQAECFRDQHALSVRVHGRTATTPFSCEDQFISASPQRGRVLHVETSTGTSYWVKTSTGWKQEHLAFVSSKGTAVSVRVSLWHV